MSSSSFEIGSAMAQRPNVLSPDQQEEGQAGTHLLSIPQDCRDIILEMVLLNREEEWDNNVIDYEVEPIKLSIPWVGDDEGPHSSPYKITDRSICIGNVGILRACRQLYLEGRYILYGRNSFISYNFPQLKYRLHRVIGRENMNIIEKLTIGLPMKHKQDPTPYLGGFLEFLKERLPNLTELNLTVQFYRFDRPLTRGSNISRVDEETRAMLNTSAWITCRHQKLKKAIWLVESGGIRGGRLLTFEEQQQGFSNDYEEPGQDLSDRVHECRLITKILATDRRFKIREQERIDLQPYPRTVAGKDIILDSRAIRRLEWAELYGKRPSNFVLEDSAVSSEPHTPPASRCREHGIYANWEVTSDFLRDRFKYLSLKDKNRLTGKEVS